MPERRRRTPSKIGDFVRIERERTGPQPGEIEKRSQRTRVMSGITQDELAARTNLPRDTIAAIERGAIAHPDPDIVHSLAAALDQPVDAFVEAMGYQLSGQTTAVQAAEQRMRRAVLRAVAESCSEPPDSSP
jgi:transcriptional regulator with XRE-family HTH domain